MIPAGQAFWVPPGVEHGGVLTQVRGIGLYISAGVMGAAFAEAPLAFSATGLMRALTQRWAETASEGLRCREMDRHMLSLLALEMAASLTRPVLLPMPRTPAMRRALSAWSVECEERVGLDVLAARCGMSRRTFTRQFRAETGLSPGAWMQSARVLRGCELMASGISVTETAFRLGYDSATSFFNLCRRVTGLNPSALARRI